jgi:hypothetical protein
VLRRKKTFTLAHQWTHLNTCASQLDLSRTKSLNNILLPLVYYGHVYIEVQKVMYGLPQAGILANQLIAHRLAIHGCHQTKFTPGLWRHVTRPIQYTLVVDDFGVQYVGTEQVHHLIAALETEYTVSKDWTGGLYYGITLNWYYVNKHVDLSMPGYIKDALHKFQHPLPKRPPICTTQLDGTGLQTTHPVCATI